MVRYDSARRHNIVSHLVKMIGDEQTDQDMMEYLMKSHDFAINTCYGLIRESHIRAAALTVQKGVQKKNVTKEAS